MVYPMIYLHFETVWTVCGKEQFKETSDFPASEQSNALKHEESHYQDRQSRYKYEALTLLCLLFIFRQSSNHLAMIY